MRRWMSVVAVLALVGLASGCSLREVQLWFAFNRHQNISAEQAKSIADLVNSKMEPGRCDSNYRGGLPGTCVPNNATWVHCVGVPGFGPAVYGPLEIRGFDSFGLDPDGDKKACVDPVGGLDYLGQTLDGIEARGWAFDPDTVATRAVRPGTGPDQIVVIEDGGPGTVVDITDPRPDVATAIPRIGVNHGFDTGRFADIGEVHQVCVFAVNTGSGHNTKLGCKRIEVRDVGEYLSGSGNLDALIEAVDLVPGGLHVRGFVASTIPSATYVLSAYLGTATRSLGLNVVRDDVNDAFGLPSGTVSGFDHVIPFSGDWSRGACLTADVPFARPQQLMCRVLQS